MANYSWDIFKTYPIRFIGYGFGMAEALRGPASPSIVHGLHIMASGFIFARTLYKPLQVSQRSQSPVKIIMWTGDTFLYELIASGAVPVFIVSVIKIVVSSGMQAKSFPMSTKLWTPALAGVAFLPIIVPFTDVSLDMIMNQTLRQLYK